ncbi:MAG TPA: DNA polymerase III subunit epsilon [Beijerinckiaceae bacterium]|nr:DNA polymerase III subunit epsilon [Beijerinckiaceae bacterium]
MREIVFDTETTGLDPATGHRLVEIGCVELLNFIPTGLTFHRYLDPQRDMPEEAFRVHGLGSEFLTGKPLFADIVEELLVFLGDARLVAHNAEFDLRFLNSEFVRTGRSTFGMERIVDTLSIARRRHPGSPNSLDALCSRYRVDNSRRTKHGALLDAEILAEVYAELVGGRQAELILADNGLDIRLRENAPKAKRPAPLPPAISAEEIEAHAQFVAGLGAPTVWRDYGLG